MCVTLLEARLVIASGETYQIDVALGKTTQTYTERCVCVFSHACVHEALSRSYVILIYVFSN